MTKVKTCQKFCICKWPTDMSNLTFTYSYPYGQQMNKRYASLMINNPLDHPHVIGVLVPMAVAVHVHLDHAK